MKRSNKKLYKFSNDIKTVNESINELINSSDEELLEKYKGESSDFTYWNNVKVGLNKDIAFIRNNIELIEMKNILETLEKKINTDNNE